MKQLTLAADKHLFGYQGEQDAAQRARARGYLLLERNYRTPYGEIDLILRSPEGELVFAEVKARSGTFFGYPEEAVDLRKKSHIIRSAYYYLQQRFPDCEEIPWRVDIMALIYKRDRKTIRDFRWFENVTADD